MRTVRLAALVALSLTAGGLALAQGSPPSSGTAAEAGGSLAGPAAPPAHVPWASLTPDQQHLLSRFSGSWDSLAPQRQQALARGSDRWLHMTPAQRATARQRFRRWQSLPPSQRQQLRQRWEQFRSLPPDRQRAVRENFRRFQSLPPRQREQLRERWRSATPAQRQRMLEQARQRAMERSQLRERGFPGRAPMGRPGARRQLFQAAPFHPLHPFGGLGRGRGGRFR